MKSQTPTCAELIDVDGPWWRVTTRAGVTPRTDGRPTTTNARTRSGRPATSPVGRPATTAMTWPMARGDGRASGCLFGGEEGGEDVDQFGGDAAAALDGDDELAHVGLVEAS